jgi:Secretion system C-terminal sorting domain/Viral BACON domain
MKISILVKTLIVGFSLLANTVFLFSQELLSNKGVISEESKCPKLSVTPLNQNVTSSSGTTSFNVASNIAWTSSSDQAWCTVTPSGNGNCTITATYQSNTGAGSRIASITVSGSGVSDQVVTVTQLGTAPSLTVTPLNQNVTSSSGTTSFNVAANVTWTSSSNQTWCTVTLSGTGNGTITATYQLNTGAGSRIASITVSGAGVSDQVVTVTQLGTAPTLVVTPLNQNVKSSSGTARFAVASNLEWTSSSDQTWCTVTPSGTDNGTIIATYQENTGTSSRVATITVKGSGVNNQVVTVTQSGTAPSLTVTPLNQNVTSSSGMTSFTVVSNVAWTSSSDQSWCTVTPSGTDNGTITVAYQENTVTGARIVTITVMGSGVNNQVVTVTQSGAPPLLIVTPLNQNVPSSSGKATFDVVSNIAWTSSGDQAWCTVTPSGTGNGTITATYQANTGAGSRVATITITGSGASNQVVTLTQDELVTISYSGSPWCSSGDVQDVSLSGTSGGTYSAQPQGLNINPMTGAIILSTSIPGSYTVKYTVEKSGGTRVLEASTEVAIYLSVTPQIVIKWADVLICSNVDNLFFGYQWFNGETPIPGANNQYYVTTKIPGVYTVETIDKNGCKTMSNEISIGGTKSLVVYPNPAKSSFNISINDVPVGKASIRIINASGTEVMNLNTEKSDFEFSKEVSTSDLDKGFYFVQVMVNEVYLYSVKIMVIK